MSDERLIAALREPRCYPHPTGPIEVVETHISWVVLAGAYAYKLRKPVDLGFVDFSSLELRRRDCEEEVRLNRRLAPDLYLGVVPVTGTRDAPVIDGDGEPIEHAVRMRRFERGAEFDAMIGRDELLPEHIDDLATRIAGLHLAAPRAPDGSTWGTPEAVQRACLENFTVVRAAPLADEAAARVARLEAWTRERLAALAPTIDARRRGGFVRECHGDLHLANVALVDGKAMAFDALEFNPSLRWTDVIAEIAFTLMDLRHRGRSDLAQRFLNGWLEITGDYAGLTLLPFHLAYRAMVRAKVAALRATQAPCCATRALHAQDMLDHLALAERLIQPRAPALLATCGVSGSGKSRIASMLAESGDWIRIRSDVERKRLAGLSPLARSALPAHTGLYSRQSTREVYSRLAQLSAGVLAAGYPVIVDATALARWQRDAMRAVARACHAPFALLSVQAPDALLRLRVAQRAASGLDPSDATIEVLERQLAHREPLDTAEQAIAVDVDSSAPVSTQALAAAIAATARIP